MIKKYLDNIRNAGLFLLIIAFVISTLWGSQHAFFPMLFAVVLLVFALAIFVFLFMNTFFPL